MLSRRRRLVTQKDFKEVFKFGKSFRGKFFKLAILWVKFSETTLVAAKAGIIVSNKVSKKATLRNKIKRIVRSFIRGKIDAVPQGSKIVIIANPQSADKNKEELLADLGTLFSRAFEL